MDLASLKELLETISRLASGETSQEGAEFWRIAGANLLITIDQLVYKAENAVPYTPKDDSKQGTCILTAMFTILSNLGQVDDVNQPFISDIWSEHFSRIGPNSETTISFYELALSRCCSLICQVQGDKFVQVQRILIKNLFGHDKICSLFASDIYMFVMRVIHPNHKTAMCQLIMNMCKLAPPDAVVTGAALVNRIKHPVINFENSNYQHLLDFSPSI